LRSSRAVGGSRRTARERFSSISPAWSGWTAPGRIGFMSTQRWEDHLRLAHCKESVGSSGDRFPCFLSRGLRVIAAGRTAPPEVPVREATNSLPLDYRKQHTVWCALYRFRHGSPPVEQAAVRKPFLKRSLVIRPSPPCRRLASPSGLAARTGCLELPEGKVRWQKKFVSPARRMRRGLRF